MYNRKLFNKKPSPLHRLNPNSNTYKNTPQFIGSKYVAYIT